MKRKQQKRRLLRHMQKEQREQQQQKDACTLPLEGRLTAVSRPRDRTTDPGGVTTLDSHVSRHATAPRAHSAQRRDRMCAMIGWVRMSMSMSMSHVWRRVVDSVALVWPGRQKRYMYLCKVSAKST